MCLSPTINASSSAGLSPNVSLPDQNTGAVRIAGDQYRKRRANAKGFASTLLTAGVGGSGLSAAAPVATKILVGS